MNEVDAIENLKDLDLIIRMLQKWGNHREALAVKLGCNVALRVSDLLGLKFDDIQDGKLVIPEQKTGKKRTITLNDSALGAIKELKVLANPGDVYLFQARGNRVQGIKPISRQYFHSKLKEVQEALNLDYRLGSHSLRKTFGYHAYHSGVDIHTLQKLFNHSSAKITLAYIGVTEKTVQDVYGQVNLG